MEIKSYGWNTDIYKTVTASQWFTPPAFTDPLVATECFIERAETKLREGSNIENVKTEAHMSLEEYRFLLEEAKHKGQREAWDLARRIATFAFGSDTYTNAELTTAFGSSTLGKIFDLSPDEAMKKDRAYQEEKKKALHVGDEVTFCDGTSNPAVKGYIVNLISPELVRVFTKEYGTYTVQTAKCKKTGKHSEEIEKVMDSFEEGE